MHRSEEEREGSKRSSGAAVGQQNGRRDRCGPARPPRDRLL